ncbi:MAG: GatB/YqeY domain-containing protein [Candidatus Omnitrophica bacterium]|nr:GatB/YqeY domain-containing protein [Candidatus Omnitrophota bacterium]
MLEEHIYQDYVNALKQKDRPKADFLSFIRGALKNRAIELKTQRLDDAETLGVLAKQKRQLQDARQSIVPSGRTDMLEKTDRELAILEGYLPRLLEEQELVAVIEEAIAQLGASSMKDMGRVMKEVLGRVGVSAEAQTVSALVKKRLS